MSSIRCEFSLLTTTQFHRLLPEESLAADKVIAILVGVQARRLNRMDAAVEELIGFKEKLFTEWSF
jgi:hypothetical protein